MESLNPEFAPYGGKNECAMTDTALLMLSEVSTRGATLREVVTIPGVPSCVAQGQ